MQKVIVQGSFSNVTQLALLACDLNMMFIRAEREKWEMNRDLLKQAESFFDSASDGRQIVQTGILTSSALEDTKAYSSFLTVQDRMKERDQEIEKFLMKLNKGVERLLDSKGEPDDQLKSDAKMVRRFFNFLNEVILERDARENPVEEVKVFQIS